MANALIGVEGMHCNHCKMAVEQALKTLDGVKEASADLASKTVSIEFDSTVITDSELKQTISDAGYEVK